MLRALRALASEVWRGSVDLLLPPACARCRRVGANASPLCTACDRRFARIPDSHCSSCQQQPSVPGSDLCAECACTVSPLIACVAPVWFDAEAEGWIHRFKYPGRGLASVDPAAAAVLRHLVCEARQRVPGPAPDLVVPVPLHPKRLRVRGFNPAAILARALARRIAADVDPVALRRVRDTPSQTGLDAQARRLNLRHAFRVRRGWRAPPRVWIVDDVVTTGSTLREAAHVLRLAGAEAVIGVCAARTPRQRTLPGVASATARASPRS